MSLPQDTSSSNTISVRANKALSKCIVWSDFTQKNVACGHTVNQIIRFLTMLETGVINIISKKHTCRANYCFIVGLVKEA